MSLVEVYERARPVITALLEKDLAKDLYYHCPRHSLDVEEQAERIAAAEGLTGLFDRYLLKIASMYHDSGFLYTYKDHELAGCEIARQQLPGFGATGEQIKIICGLIMATRIPQTPLTKLEEVICDADLDYLGRPDFFPISNNLFRELKARDFLKTERDWNLVQVKFFQQHSYFTKTNKHDRAPGKSRHLQMIEALLVE